MLTASTALSTSGVEAEPLWRKDNMDTRGSAMPTTLRAFLQWILRYPANCSLVGLGNTPQSEEYEHTVVAIFFLLVNMNMEEDTV